MKQWIWNVFCVAFLCLFIAIPAAADTLYQEAWVEPTADIADWESLLYEPTVLFQNDGPQTNGTAWVYQYDARNASPVANGKKLVTDISALPFSGGRASYSYYGNIRVHSGALSFGIYLSNAENYIYKVQISCHTAAGNVVFQADAPANQRLVIHCDAAELGTEIDGFTLLVEYDSEEAPASIELIPPCVTSSNPWRVRQYMAEEITAQIGSVQCIDGDGMYLFPNADGDVVITGIFARSATEYPAGEVALCIVLDGIENGGTLTCTLRNGESETTGSKPVRIAEGMQYRISLSALMEAGTLPWTEYTLTFENVSAVDTYSFSIRSISVVVYEKEAETGATVLGGLEKYSLVLAGDTGSRQLDCSGKIRREIVRQYNKGQIVLLALPDGEDGASLTLATAPVANTFDFHVSFTPLQEKADIWQYTVAIRITDEYGETRDLYLANPGYYQGKEPSSSTLSILGLENASAMGVYESNVSHVVVDVPLDTLITIPFGEKSVTCRRGDTVVALNADFLTQLDGDIPFYQKAGLEIWLRITSETPIDGLTYNEITAASYMPCVTDERSMEIYGAIISFLAERYTGVDGIILGRGLNCEKYVGAPLTNTVMDELGVLAAYTYRVAEAKSPGIMLVLPFGDGYAYSEENALYSDAITYNPEGVCARITSSMNACGETAWLLGWYFHDAEQLSVSCTGTIAASLAEDDMYSGLMYFWEPDSKNGIDGLVENYAAVCQTTDKPRAVVLSLRWLYANVAQKTYAAVNSIGSGERSVENLRAIVGDASDTLQGKIQLWDFSTLYHNDNWLAGGGITSLITDYSTALSTWSASQSRSLQSVMPVERYVGTDDGIAGGILLGDLARSVDCRTVTDLTFTVAVYGTDRPVTLIFLAGADDCRAEYSIDPITEDGVYTIHCDLTEYTHAQTIEYVGILIYAESDVTLEVSSVTAGSSMEDGATLYNRFYPHEDEESVAGNAMYAVYILLLAAVFSICTIVLLNRRDREEAERMAEEISRRRSGGKYRV